MNKKRAFTLIELLVVIAVIGLLASIVLVAVNSVRGKARNTKRLSDIRQYVLALEMIYDVDNEYPDPGDTAWHCLGDYSDDNCWNNGSYDESSTLNNIFDDYIPSLPADEMVICGHNGDPNNCYEGYLYRRLADGSINIRWFLEGNDQSCGTGQDMGTDCADCTYCRYDN